MALSAMKNLLFISMGTYPHIFRIFAFFFAHFDAKKRAGACAGNNDDTGAITPSMDTCDDRMSTKYGSSKNYAITQRLNSRAFKTSPSKNVLLYNWCGAFIPSCDGGFFLGDAPSSSSGSSGPFYKGSRIVDGVIQDLIDHRGLDKATDVVISGCGMGMSLFVFFGGVWTVHAVLYGVL